MMRQSTRKHQKISPFIKKLYNILEDHTHSAIVSWTLNQEAFVVFDHYQFSTIVLPKYFRHKNYSSFLRQLSFYNFTKKRSSKETQHSYFHPLFKRQEVHNHHMIKRIDLKAQQNNKALNSQQNMEQVQQSKECEQKVYSMERELDKLRNRQAKLKKLCESMLRQNKEIIFDNYILKATIQDESTNNKLILDRIQNFLINYSSSYDLNYCDFDIVKGLLNFLDKKDWELLLEEKPREIMDNIIKLIENNQIFVLLNVMSSSMGQRKRKQSYTIMKKQRGIGEKYLQIQLQQQCRWKDYAANNLIQRTSCLPHTK